jgi:hypothetical protein
MPTDAIALFLRRVKQDRLLRQEITAVARRYGYRFTVDELGAVDLERQSGIRTTTAEPDNTSDEDRTDQGFGIIEVPA